MTKYESIASEIRSRIQNGRYIASKPLPDEMTLCEEFGCSRMTMKKALELLVLEGLLYRKRGHGTFIMPAAMKNGRVNVLNNDIKGLTANIRDKNITSEIIRFDVEFAGEPIKERLGFDENTPVYHILRLRKVDGQPYVIERTYMPTTTITGLTEEVLKGSIYSYIQEELGLTITSAHKIIRADKAGTLDVEYLACELGEPVLEVEQVAYLGGGQPFEYSFSRHHYDKFEFTSYIVNR